MTNYSKKFSLKVLVSAFVAVLALTVIVPAVALAQVPASNPSNGDVAAPSAPASAPAPASNDSNGDVAAPAAPAANPSSGTPSGAPASNSSNGDVAAPASNPSNGDVVAPAANPSNGGSSTGPGIVPASNPSNGSTGPGIVAPAANPSNGGSSTGPGSVPASNPSNGSVTSGSAPASNPSNGSATESTPVTPSNPPVTGGGNGNGSLPLGNGPIVVNAAPGAGSVNQNPNQTVVNPSSCSLIGAQIIIGAANNSTDVANLQKFLNQYEGAKLAVNGTYDASTIEAVKSFQAKYASEILAPWGISTPTGNVFITTRVKIDEITCGKSIGLTANEQSIISSYKSQNENGAVIGTPSTGGTPSTTPVVGSNGSSQTVAKKSFFQNTASVILAVPKAVGRFFKNLF